MTKHMSSHAAKSNAFPGAANDRAPIRVLAVDPSPMIRLGLEIWIRDTPGIELVGQAADATTALSVAAEVRPDIVLTEAVLPDMSAATFVETLRKLSCQPEVIILSGRVTLPSIVNIARAGAKGFVSKEAQPDVVVNTIAMVSRGFICLPEFASRADGFQTLSAREEEVLKKLLAGETNRMIAEELSLNEKTVSYYKCAGLKKLNVQSIAQLAMLEIKPW
ncbi:LuxR C-terminal-related transcriptional regulator [Uliginosibacterium sp. sgz301328]|uniref:LuxR C-terminal-related transcriptional regulator n=1 Tax=Uliginosibacterium sp. sgz301328 TaxID=3243764 RepID=UPI00359D49D0